MMHIVQFHGTHQNSSNKAQKEHHATPEPEEVHRLFPKRFRNQSVIKSR